MESLMRTSSSTDRRLVTTKTGLLTTSHRREPWRPQILWKLVLQMFLWGKDALKSLSQCSGRKCVFVWRIKFMSEVRNDNCILCISKIKTHIFIGSWWFYISLLSLCPSCCSMSVFNASQNSTLDLDLIFPDIFETVVLVSDFEYRNL